MNVTVHQVDGGWIAVTVDGALASFTSVHPSAHGAVRALLGEGQDDDAGDVVTVVDEVQELADENWEQPTAAAAEPTGNERLLRHAIDKEHHRFGLLLDAVRASGHRPDGVHRDCALCAALYEVG